MRNVNNKQASLVFKLLLPTFLDTAEAALRRSNKLAPDLANRTLQPLRNKTAAKSASLNGNSMARRLLTLAQ